MEPELQRLLRELLVVVEKYDSAYASGDRQLKEILVGILGAIAEVDRESQQRQTMALDAVNALLRRIERQYPLGQDEDVAGRQR